MIYAAWILLVYINGGTEFTAIPYRTERECETAADSVYHGKQENNTGRAFCIPGSK